MLVPALSWFFAGIYGPDGIPFALPDGVFVMLLGLDLAVPGAVTAAGKSRPRDVALVLGLALAVALLSMAAVIAIQVSG